MRLEPQNKDTITGVFRSRWLIYLQKNVPTISSKKQSNFMAMTDTVAKPVPEFDIYYKDLPRKE